VCGDIGLGFNKEQYHRTELEKLNKVCEKRNVYVLLLRGNHDDPQYFKDNKIDYSHVKAISDYTIVETGNKNILCVGGAVSIDRSWRMSEEIRREVKYLQYHPGASKEKLRQEVGQMYWMDETPYFDEEFFNELSESGIKIDYVATHTCPSFCELRNKNGITEWLERDKTLEGDVNAERSVLDKISNALIEGGHNIKMWCYGHFHTHIEEEINGTRYVMLNMCQNNKIDVKELR
jgi:UDP-2,3-diacylglucosamine pyrophosphatase LpxH